MGSVEEGSSSFSSVSRRGGRNKGGRKQMRSKRRGANASKRKQTRANVDKRKQTLTPPFIAVFYTPLCNPLILGQPVCRTKLPRKVVIPKRKMVRKTARNFPEKFEALFCCVESLTGTIQKYFTTNSRTKSNIVSRRESAGMATLTLCNPLI